jgi:hypothetical protein
MLAVIDRVQHSGPVRRACDTEAAANPLKIFARALTHAIRARLVFAYFRRRRICRDLGKVCATREIPLLSSGLYSGHLVRHKTFFGARPQDRSPVPVFGTWRSAIPRRGVVGCLRR